MADFRWNETAGRYIDNETGKFVSKAYVMDLLEQSLASTTSVTDTLATYVYNGEISIPDWTTLMRNEIKGEYIRQYLAGVGGREMMTQSDWGKLGAMLKEQYNTYLKGFARDIPNLSEGQIKMRAAMYIDSAHKAYEEANAKVAAGLGFDEVFWEVDPQLENCEICLGRMSQGWVPVGENGGFIDEEYGGEVYPGDGNSYCLTKCGCHLRYRNSQTGEEMDE